MVSRATPKWRDTVHCLNSPSVKTYGFFRLEESGMFKNGQKRKEGGLRSSICPLVSLSVNRWRHYKSPLQASYTQN